MATRQRRRGMRLFAGVGLLAVLVWPAHAQGTQAAAGPATPSTPSTPSTPAPTLFGHGPELYISPQTGPIGTRIAVLGLGYRPGTCLEVDMLAPMTGTGGATGRPCGRGQAVVDAMGRLHATLVVPASLRLPRGVLYRPFVVMTYNDAATSEATTYKASSIFLETLF